jgi:hypothetical protein
MAPDECLEGRFILSTGETVQQVAVRQDAIGSVSGQPADVA